MRGLFPSNLYTPSRINDLKTPELAAIDSSLSSKNDVGPSSSGVFTICLLNYGKQYYWNSWEKTSISWWNAQVEVVIGTRIMKWNAIVQLDGFDTLSSSSDLPAIRECWLTVAIWWKIFQSLWKAISIDSNDRSNIKEALIFKQHTNPATFTWNPTKILNHFGLKRIILRPCVFADIWF